MSHRVVQLLTGKKFILPEGYNAENCYSDPFGIGFHNEIFIPRIQFVENQTFYSREHNWLKGIKIEALENISKVSRIYS